MEKLKVIVFDFDGVLVDSNKFKIEIWFKIFPKNNWSVLRGVLKSMGNESRYKILEKLLSDLGEEKEDIPSLVRKYALLYDRHIQMEIQRIGLVPHALSLFRFLKKKGCRLYINTATPEDAIKKSITNLKIKKYFRGMLGSPSTKVENLLKIISKEKIKTPEILFIGDGENDWRAAKEAGLAFIGIVNYYNRWAKTPFPLARNLLDVIKLLNI